VTVVAQAQTIVEDVDSRIKSGQLKKSQRKAEIKRALTDAGMADKKPSEVLVPGRSDFDAAKDLVSIMIAADVWSVDTVIEEVSEGNLKRMLTSGETTAEELSSLRKQIVEATGDTYDDNQSDFEWWSSLAVVAATAERGPKTQGKKLRALMRQHLKETPVGKFFDWLEAAYNDLFKKADKYRAQVKKGVVPARAHEIAMKAAKGTIVKADTGNVLTVPESSHSLRTIPTWQNEFRKQATKAGFKKRWIEKQLKAIKTHAAIVAAHPDLLPYDQNDPVQLDKWSPVRKNIAYTYSMDMDTICPKNIQFNANVAQIEEQLGRFLSGKEAAQLAMYMKAMKQMSPCLYCYVETKRRELKTAYANHLKYKRDVFKKADKDGKADFDTLKKLMYGYDAKKDTMTNGATTQLNKWIAEWNADAEAGRKHAPLSQRKIRESLKKGTNQTHEDAMAYAKSATSANVERGYGEYGGQWFDHKATLIEVAEAMGGLRGFSLSDFKIDHTIDMMQMIMDLTVLKKKLHFYTKQPEFAEIFGGTGIKINLSCAVNADGSPDLTWGIDWKKAKALREKYPDVGVMFMVTDVDQLKWAMEQDWIGLIIPFHRSGMPSKMIKAMGWTDFESQQNERPWVKKQLEAAGKTKRDHPDVKHIQQYDYTTKGGTLVPGHGGDLKKYLALCDQFQLNPKFYKNEFADGTKVIDHPGYMKLVTEFARSDTKHNPVNSEGIDFDAFEKIFKGWAQQEGYEREKKFDPGTVKSFMDFYAGKNREFSEFPPEAGIVGGAKEVVKKPEIVETSHRLWAVPKQKISSADTSINVSKTGAVFNKVDFKKGTVNADIGGGRFNNATHLLKKKGVTNVIFDPFNRSQEHNEAAAAKIKDGQADTATVSNVLNVIKEPENRSRVIEQAANAVGDTGTAYITVYEGDRSGKGKETSKGFQLNRKLSGYTYEVKRHFKNVTTSKGMIVASNPTEAALDHGDPRISHRLVPRNLVAPESSVSVETIPLPRTGTALKSCGRRSASDSRIHTSARAMRMQ
jgi:hypothetical protein